MPVGTNPGIYIDIIPLEFAPDVSNDSTHSVFVGFSRRGPDNKLIRLTSPRKYLQILGYPKKSLYSQQIFNGYNHSLVSGNTKFLRVLPNVEDVSDPGTDLYNQTFPSPATFANINMVVFESNNNIMPKLMVPINFVPDHWKNPSAYNDPVNASKIPKMVENIFKYEAENSQDIATTIGNPTPISKSTTLSIYYNEEPVDVTIAGTVANNNTVDITYNAFKDSINEYLTNIPENVKHYYDAFLENVKISYSIPQGSINIAKNIYSTTVPANGQINISNTSAVGGYSYLVTTYTLDTNGNSINGCLYALSKPSNNIITLPTSEAGKNVLIYPLPHNKVVNVDPLSSVKIPSGVNYLFCTCEGIDFVKANHTVITDDTGMTITNISSASGVLLYQQDDTSIGYSTNKYMIKSVVLPIHTDEITTEVIANYSFIVDKMANDFGYYILPFYNSEPFVIDSSKSYSINNGNFSADIKSNESGNNYIRLFYIQAVDNEASLEAKILMSILAEGRGGWYNSVALQLTPSSIENSSGNIIPSARKYNLSTMVYNYNLQSYIGVGTPVEFSIYPEDTDDTGNNVYMETIVNSYATYIMMYSNNELITELKNVSATDNRFANLYEQMFYYSSKSFSDKLILNGGEDGCLRNRSDCSINWKQANSCLVLAYQGIYDQTLYDTDNMRAQLVFDADYADPIKKAIINMCELRKDCVAILDAPKKPSVDLLTQWYDNFGTNSYYAALFAPHTKVYDAFEKDYVWMSPSYCISYQAPYNDLTYGFYQPMSGLERGVIRFSVDKFGINIPLTELSADQQQTYARSINLLGKKKGTNVIWGNYTLTRRNNAMQSLHVMRLMTQLVWEFKSLSSNIWDLMTPNVLTIIKNKAIAILNTYLGTAIDKFNVSLSVSEYDRQRRTVNLLITIKPYLEIRRIYIQFTVS